MPNTGNGKLRYCVAVHVHDEVLALDIAQMLQSIGVGAQVIRDNDTKCDAAAAIVDDEPDPPICLTSLDIPMILLTTDDETPTRCVYRRNVIACVAKPLRAEQLIPLVAVAISYDSTDRAAEVTALRAR